MEILVIPGMLVPGAIAVATGSEARAWGEALASQRGDVDLRFPSGPLDQAGIRHVHFWRLSQSENLAGTLSGATRLLGHARIDIIQLPWTGDAAAFFRLDQAGYAIVRADAAGLRVVAGLAALPHGEVFAVHRRMLPFFELAPRRFYDIGTEMRRFGLTPAGVIHVGAHEGGEHDGYLAAGFSRWVYVEANPQVFATLRARLGGRPGVDLVNVAVADRAGTMPFRLTSFDQSSSLLQLGRHREVYPMVDETAVIEVQTVTLDSLMTAFETDRAAFNLLNLDVQGAELMVLRGAQRILAQLAAVNCEVNFLDLYQGGAQIEEIDDFMGAAGFRRVVLATPMHPSWGEALYLRNIVAGAGINQS